MLNELENYYFSLPEPDQSTLLFLRQFILNHSKNITEHFKFRTPFFYFNGKMFCYFSIEKKTSRIYIGFVKGHAIKHKALIAGNRTQIKVYYIEKDKDVRINELKAILKEAEKLM